MIRSFSDPAGALAPGLLAFSFANPWLLWGLALGAIPVFIHLLHRRAYRETDWAAMRFLLEAARKNSRKMRLEQLVLLTVRMLVLLLAALAFAEPLWQSFAQRSQARAPLHRVIVIDASFSMGERLEGDTRFARAKKFARQIVAESIAGDAVNVLRIAEHSPPAIVREPSFEREAVLSEIDRLQSTDEPADLRPALREVLEILADSRTPRTKEVVFISDFQRLTWGTDRVSPANSDLHNLLAHVADRARIILLNVGEGPTDNAAVTALATADSLVVPERPTRLRAAIRNYGDSPLSGLRVELYVDGYLAASKSADLPAREETSVEFSPLAFHAAGDHAVEVRLPPDRLAADNQRWLSVPVAERMHVLIVNAHQGRRPSENASFYLRTVLAPSTSRESWNGPVQPKVIPEADLAAEDLARYDCVILCDVALVTPTEAALLKAYTERGGGLILTLGAQIQPENYNAMLYRDGQGVLPVPLGSRIGDARTSANSNRAPGGFTFDAGDLSHPILSAFRGNPRAGLDRVVTLEYVQAKVPSGSPARVVLRFNSGDPAIVERQIGRGHSVLVTTTADVTWSTWPVHPTFPPLIHSLVRFAAEGRGRERQRLVGEPLTRFLSSREAGVRVVVKNPDGIEQIIRPALVENQAEFVFSDTFRRGIYEMTLAGPTSPAPLLKPVASLSPGSTVAKQAGAVAASSSAARPELYAVNVDTRESDLEQVEEKILRSTTFAGISYVHRGQWSEEPRDSAESELKSSPLTNWLLMAMLGLLLVEPLMAWSFRHGLLLLCTFAAAGLSFSLVPHDVRGGMFIGILLAAGALATALVGNDRRVSPPATGEFQPQSRFRKWFARWH